MTRAMLLCAGLGTRLGPLSDERPKPMLPVCEANPAMQPVVKNSAAFIAVKAGATAGVIWASEKMWKKNRKAAVVFATVVNVAMAAIVANNYRVSR